MKYQSLMEKSEVLAEPHRFRQNFSVS